MAVIPRGFLSPGTMDYDKFHKSICPPTEPAFTPDEVAPNRVFRRRLFESFDLPLPYPNPTTGQNFIEMWVIADPGLPLTFPSPPIVVRQGDIVHVETRSRRGPHTIHFHGIEPTPMNDGVGHDSFEVGGNYTYQWQANEPGTYFYHCHANTVFHVEMGMYGGLIIDPPQGRNHVVGFNPPDHVIRFDVEAIWVCDEMDSRWHAISDPDAFMAACTTNPNEPNNPVFWSDPNNPNTFTSGGFFHDFRPDVFTITGVARANDATPITDPRVAITARVGQTILIRLIHAGYTVQQYTLGLDALAIATDGRPYGVPPLGSYSEPFVIPAGRPFRFTSARRRDLIIRPTQTGVFPVSVEFFDWITGRRYGVARTTITVNP